MCCGIEYQGHKFYFYLVGQFLEARTFFYENPAMIKVTRKDFLPIFLWAAFSCTPALAKDLATEQYNVTAAKKEYAEAKSDYDAATQSVKEQEKRVSQEQARLKEQKKKQASAKDRLAKAKSNLDKQQKVIDKAWKSEGN
jgi:septal ring factor EnvC (AmiA/AmiB activator)